MARTETETETGRDDYAEHLRTYRGFVRGVVIFVAHVAVILLFLGWWFSPAFV
ncbi:MAG: aa3-type cytochrome c oxidase subunit IV [Hyphomicrobiales bacterium]|nr:MAG: aa3-type cytochrome c oxidase subunit IV [Hyphomicrobiales bacterium]